MRISTRLQFGSIIRTALVCLSVALILSSCKKKTPQEQILGKWNVTENQSAVEYRNDGTFTTTANGKSTTGKYRFTDDTHVELDVSEMAGTNALSLRLNCEIKFHDDQADLTATMAGKPGTPAISQTLHYVRAN